MKPGAANQRAGSGRGKRRVGGRVFQVPTTFELPAVLLALAMLGACARFTRGPAEPPRGTRSGMATTAPVPLVVELADESSPHLLPDGTLLYVSNRGGDRNLWLRRPGSGWSRRLTSHSADDFDPAPAPDGKSVAFVSLRNDAKGDLYLLSLDGREPPQRLSDSSLGELEPDWLPDGSGLVFARPRGGVYLLDLQSHTIRRLGRLPGRQPAVSPDGKLVALIAPRQVEGRQRPCLWLHHLASGRDWPLDDCPVPAGFPAWMQFAGRLWLVHSRFADDSDGDGEVTVNDRPSLWLVPVVVAESGAVTSGAAWPLTAGIRAAIQPRARDRRVVWTVQGSGDLDIWSMDVVLPRLGSCRDIAAAAARAEHPLRSIMLLRQRLAWSNDERERRACRLEVAEQLQLWGRYQQAATMFSEVASRAGDERMRQRALLGLLATEVARDFPENLDPARREELQPQARRLLQRLEQVEGHEPQRRLVAARLAARVGWFDQALEGLATLVVSPWPGVAGAARLEKAGLQWRLGRENEALTTLLQLALDTKCAQLDRQRAARQLVAWARKLPGRQGWPADYLEVLESLSQQAGGREPLASELRLAIAAEQLQRGRLELAQEALRRVERLAGTGRHAGQALLLLAQLAEKRGHIGEALDHVAEIYERYGNDWELVRPALRLARRLGLSHARRLLASNEAALAATVLQRLLKVVSDDVAVWREWLVAMQRCGRLPLASTILEQRLEQRPDEPLSWYLYGLLLTYREPPHHFRQALEYLQRAEQLDPQAPYQHQTTGWLYEQLARIEDNPEHLLAAVRHYELALSLLDREQSEGRADLHLNLANVYLQLGDAEQAWHFYRLRYDSGVPFRDRRRRQLFLENSGRAAFLSGRFTEAAGLWQQARKLLEGEGGGTRLPRLTAAVGAAWQMSGHYDRAAEQFEHACRLYRQQGRKRGWARCLRSRGYNLFRAGSDERAFAVLEQARQLFARLRRGDVERPGISLGISTGASRAPTGFTLDQELDFIDALLARLAERGGDWLQAAALRRRRLQNLQTRQRLTDDPTLWLDISLESSRLAYLYWQNGFPRLALSFLLPAGEAAARADSAEGRAYLALALLEVARSGWVPVGANLLRQRLQDALDGLELLEEGRTALAARLANGLAVALAEQAWQQLGQPLAGNAPGQLLRRGLARLDSAVASWQQALAAARQAWRLAQRVSGRQGAVLQAQAAWNLSQLCRLAGSSSEAERWHRRSRELVSDHGLVELLWRLDAVDGKEQSAVRLLVGLPPDFSGTADSSLLRREQDQLMARLVQRAAGGNDAREVLRWLDTWIALRRRDRLWADLPEQAAYAGQDWSKWLRGLAAARHALEAARRQPPETATKPPWKETLQRLSESLAGRGLLPAGVRRLVAPEPLSWSSVAERMTPDTALVAAAALSEQTLLVVATAERQRLWRLPPGRDRIERLLADCRRPGRAARDARRRLAELLEPVLRSLGPETNTLLVADGLLDLPWEQLPERQGLLGERYAIVRVSAPGDLLDFERDINVNFAGARWYGSAPSPRERRTVEGLYGSVQVHGELDSGTKRLSAGLLVLEADWETDRSRPGRSRIGERLPRSGISGGHLGELARLAAGAGLVVLLPHQPLESSPALGYMLDLLARLGRLPHLVLLPSQREVAGRMLVSLLEAWRDERPANAWRRALAAVGPALAAGKLSEARLRGAVGLDESSRRRLAEARLGQVAGQAMSAFRRQRWSEALDGFAALRTLAMYLGRDELLLAAGKGLVTCAFNLGLLPLARRTQLQLLELVTGRGDRAGRAAALKLLGVVESRLGQHSRAAEHMQAAYELFQQLGAKSAAAATLVELALARSTAADYRRALKHLQEAQKLYAGLNLRRQVARALRLQATIRLRRLHDIAGARRAYQRAERELARLDPPAAAGMRLDLARTELAAGNYDRAGRLAADVARQARQLGRADLLAEARLEEAKVLWYQGAFLQARRVQQISLATAREAGNRRLTISALSLGGLLLADLGRLDEAVGELEKALAQARQAGLEDEEASQLNNLGFVERRRGRLERALQLHDQAEAIDLRLKNLAGQAYDLRNSGLVLLYKGRLNQARQRLQRAERISDGLGDRFNQAQAALGLAWVELASDAHEAAQRQARSALNMANELGIPALAWQAHQALGDAARAGGRLEQARRHYLMALDLVEKLPAGAASAGESVYQASRRRLYDDLELLLMQLQLPERALEIEERRRLSAIAGRLRLLELEAGAAETKSGRALPGQLAQLERIRTETRDLLKRRRRRLAADEALLVFRACERATVVWLASRSVLQARVVRQSRQEMQGRVAGLLEGLAAKAPLGARLRELHRLLVEPFAAELASVRLLGVLPDEVLAPVPFAALRNRAGNYLYQLRSVYRLPSLLLSMPDTVSSEEAGPAPGTLLLASAPGRFELPFASLELQRLLETRPEAVVLQGQMLAGFTSQAAAADRIHIAAHGLVGPDGSPALALAGDELLDLKAVLHLTLRARLVVLAGCRTAIAPASGEVLSLADAFLLAGSSQVLGSLWKVSDVASALLIKRFYRHLDAEGVWGALHRARDTVRRYFPHPAYWAGFTVLGGPPAWPGKG